MSGWCQAASDRCPTVLITISVPFQLLVLYFRRIQPSSRYQCGSSCLRRASTSASLYTRSDVAIVAVLWKSDASPLQTSIAEASTRSMAAISAQWRSKSKARAPARQVSVTTTARLHFGFLDPSGRGKRPFGSFGLSLDRPTTRIMLERADGFEAIGPERERGLRYLRSIA